MCRLVSLLRIRWEHQHRTPLRVGIGINSGDVIAGDAGFAQRREYQVVGPDVALAHRLAAGTMEINAYIVAARATVEPIEDLYNLVPVSGIPLPGLRALLDAFIVRGRKRSDPVYYPKAGAFANTVLDESLLSDSLEPIETVPLESFDAPPATRTKPEPPPPPPPPPEVPFSQPKTETKPPDAPLVTRRVRPDDAPAAPRKRAPGEPAFGPDVPELRIPSFGGTDESSAMPDPPPPRATYEDNDGPPLVL